MKMTTQQLAESVGVPHWRIRRAYDAIRPDSPRIAGRIRLIDATDVPELLAEILRRESLARNKTRMRTLAR